jgi:hypothetical protein
MEVRLLALRVGRPPFTPRKLPGLRVIVWLKGLGQFKYPMASLGNGSGNAPDTGLSELGKLLVDNVAQGRVPPGYFGFPCQFSFH